MRIYWTVLLKGERVSPLFIEKVLAIAWAESHYDIDNDDVQITDWWE